jgi:hypothetical protein
VPGLSHIAAISPDGTMLAYPGPPSRPGIRIISLATGAVRTWATPGRWTGAMSWDGNRRLAFAWGGPSHRRHPAVSVLDTASPVGSLMASSRLLIPATVRFGRFTNLTGWITATSSAVYAVMEAPGPPAARSVPPFGPLSRPAVVAFSARTGRPMRVISQASESSRFAYCGVLWADRSGRQVVTSCGYQIGLTRDGTFTLWSRHSFAPLHAAFAW